mmetsp:Transcript_5869/g.14073  ORF Transcript_5869/g.14073 Transcript_5869/m.14073 type:complete len:211 (-) Transcript_5869:1246-1878(-)
MFAHIDLRAEETSDNHDVMLSADGFALQAYNLARCINIACRIFVCGSSAGDTATATAFGCIRLGLRISLALPLLFAGGFKPCPNAFLGKYCVLVHRLLWIVRIPLETQVQLITLSNIGAARKIHLEFSRSAKRGLYNADVSLVGLQHHANECCHIGLLLKQIGAKDFVSDDLSVIVTPVRIAQPTNHARSLLLGIHADPVSVFLGIVSLN